MVRIMAKTTFIDRAIEVNEKHINEYQLESNTGTKKMQEKFYKNAVNARTYPIYTIVYLLCFIIIVHVSTVFNIEYIEYYLFAPD